MINLRAHWGHWLLTGLMTTALVACAGSTTPEISRTEDPAASENTATATAAGDAIKIGALMPMTLATCKPLGKPASMALIWPLKKLMPPEEYWANPLSLP